MSRSTPLYICMFLYLIFFSFNCKKSNQHSKGEKERLAAIPTATSTTHKANGTVLLFENETFDFGKVDSANGRIDCSFTFKNISNHDISFTKCVASHGVTRCNYRSVIPHNSTDSIQYFMSIKGKKGKFKKTIHLNGYINKDPKEEFIQYLNVKGEIIK